MKPWKRCYLKGKNGHGIFVMLKTGLLWSTIFKSSNVLPLPHQNKKRRQKEQIFDQSIELEKRVKCMGDPLDGDNSIVEYLPESQCKTCKSQWVATFELDYVNYPMFLITYMQSIYQKTWSVRKFYCTIDVVTKAIFTRT